MKHNIMDSPVPLLFKKILRENLSGHLEIRDKNHFRSLYFMDGKLVEANSNVFDEQIGVILHLTGKIDQEQYDFISGLAHSVDHEVGKILVQNHFINENELQKAMLYKTRHVAISTFSINIGEWEFVQETLKHDPHHHLPIPLPGIIYEGGRHDEIVHFCKKKFYFFTPTLSKVPEQLIHLFTEKEFQLLQNLKECQQLGNDEILARYNLSPDFYWQIISVFWLFGIIDFSKHETQHNIEEDLVSLIKMREKIESQNPNEFEILGVNEETTIDKLEACYYTLAQIFNPARFGSAFAPEIKKSAQLVSEKIQWAFEKIKKEIRQTTETAAEQVAGKIVEDAEEDDSEERFSKARGLYKQNQFNDAVVILKDLVQHAPANAKYHYYLGLSQVPLEYFQVEAENHLKKAIELEPWNPEPVYALGTLFKQVKKFKLAEKCFLRTLEINPGFRQGNDALKELRQPTKKKKESIFKKKIF